MSRSYEAMMNEIRQDWDEDAHETSRKADLYFEALVDASVALGNEFAVARREAHLSQSELAAMASVHQSEISKIERGVANPTRDTLVKLASSLGKTLTLSH